jgi:CubicO group peptidase (beta-lactamase class C family)
MTRPHLPDWVVYPMKDWLELTPQEAGLDPVGFAAFLRTLAVRGADRGGEDHTASKWGAVLTRGGYVVHVWGDRNYRFQTASTGKAFMWVLLGLAASEGLLDPDEPIHKSWTGEGQLSHEHKYLDHGHHKKLTWRHLIGDKRGMLHYGGFPMEYASRWREKRSGHGEDHESVPGVPDWASWTGDPFFDLYSHAEPGTVGLYSSAGFWRLAQALTAVWGQDLKVVLDEQLFGRIGIPSERWDWHTGAYMRDHSDFYPSIPDTYTYLDPPYELGGQPVRGGAGWVTISASDLARFGHLIATEGNWEGEQLADVEWLRGHGGGNGSGVSGESEHFTAMGVVTTEGLGKDPSWHNTTISSFLPQELFIGPVVPAPH